MKFDDIELEGEQTAREETVELPFEPFEHQRLAHQLRLAVRFLVLVWHRRAGKTVFAIVELVLAAAACTRPMGRYGYIAPELKQAKTVAWDYLKKYARGIPGAVIHEAETQITLPNGAKVRLFGADNPDSFRGTYFDGVVLDEVAQMKPEVWGEIIRPALSDRQGWAIFIGTPKGVNLFSELYFRALKTPEDAGYVPGWAADMRRHDQTTQPLTREEVELARYEMSGPQFAQEYECDFAAASDNVLNSLSDVLAATRRSLMGHEFADEVKILGVDVARFGSDRSVLFGRQGKVAFAPKVFKQLDTMTLAGHVATFIQKWDPDAVFVDVTGIGAGVVDRLRQLSYPVIGVDFGEAATKSVAYANKRVEMWDRCSHWIKSGGCLPDNQDLIRELTAPMYGYTLDNRMKLESKDDIKARGLASPDLADALVLTFAQPVAHRGLRGRLERARMPVEAQGSAAHDYDPMEA